MTEVIESADGTRIALDQSGSGPPLVIVVGAFCDRSTSKSLAALLAPSYTVHEYDRRGRGDSGNGVPCPIGVEVQDLAAVVAAAGEPPFIYGHSSGGLLALEAAARGVEMRSLAVYEPPYTGDHHPGAGFGVHLDQLERIEVPVLAMAGGASPPWAAATTATLAGVLPHACQLIVEGQQHLPADPVIATILESFFPLTDPVLVGARAATAEE